MSNRSQRYSSLLWCIRNFIMPVWLLVTICYYQEDLRYWSKARQSLNVREQHHFHLHHHLEDLYLSCHLKCPQLHYCMLSHHFTCRVFVSLSPEHPCPQSSSTSPSLSQLLVLCHPKRVYLHPLQRLLSEQPSWSPLNPLQLRITPEEIRGVPPLCPPLPVFAFRVVIIFSICYWIFSIPTPPGVLRDLTSPQDFRTLTFQQSLDIFLLYVSSVHYFLESSEWCGVRDFRGLKITPISN